MVRVDADGVGVRMQRESVDAHRISQMIGELAEHLAVLWLHAPVDGSVLAINDDFVKSAQVISAKDD